MRSFRQDASDPEVRGLFEHLPPHIEPLPSMSAQQANPCDRWQMIALSAAWVSNREGQNSRTAALQAYSFFQPPASSAACTCKEPEPLSCMLTKEMRGSS